jgi:hypothetical protein
MQPPKLHVGDLDHSEFAKMATPISAATGGAHLVLRPAVVSEVLDVLMPPGATAPRVDAATPGRLVALLWPGGAPSCVDLDVIAGVVESTLADWHLLH